ncbi:hypothetical protein MTO96_048668 [Rhipicephalus appendiculatus]
MPPLMASRTHATCRLWTRCRPSGPTWRTSLKNCSAARTSTPVSHCRADAPSVPARPPTKPRAMEQSSVDGPAAVPASTTPNPVAPSKRSPSSDLSPQAGTPAKMACVRSADSEASSTTSHHSERLQRPVAVTTAISAPVVKPGPPPSSPPSEWSIEDVIRYISNLDAALATHSDLFRRHEIDGRALLLLNSDMMMKYMGLKLGPALKICNIIDKIKGKKAL